MTKTTATVLVAVGVTGLVVLLAMAGGLSWEDVISWLIVVPICLGIIGYAWHLDRKKRMQQ